MNRVIACPGCRAQLHVPADAGGKPAHCPHCRAAFRLTPDGNPAPIPAGLRLPRLLVVPAFGLLMLGVAGTLVNGYLSVLFTFVPGADREFARGRVREVRSAQILSDAGKPHRWVPMPYAAVAGVAAGSLASEAEQDRLDEELARTWAPGMKPLHWISTAVSAVVLLGGFAILRGRWYALALLGSVAAIVNVNHLCCLPGAVAGVWGVMTLVRDEARAYFGRG